MGSPTVVVVSMLALHDRHALDQPGGQRREPSQRLLQRRAAPHRLPRWGDDHLPHRRGHHALAADDRPRGLHLHLAHRVRRAAGTHRRHHALRLLHHPPDAQLGRRGALRPDGEYGGVNWAAIAGAGARRCCRTCRASSMRPPEPPGPTDAWFATFFDTIYGYAWFIGLPLAMLFYWLFMRGSAPSPSHVETTTAGVIT